MRVDSYNESQTFRQ